MIINMEKEFSRVRSAKDITIFASLIIIGSVLVALPTGAGINTAGFFLIFTGAILALVLRTGYKDSETGEKYRIQEYYFQQSLQSCIASAISSKPDTLDLDEADKGNGLKLEIFYSKSTGKAYLRLFEYVPYRYEPCSQTYEHDLDKVTKLIR